METSRRPDGNEPRNVPRSRLLQKVKNKKTYTAARVRIRQIYSNSFTDLLSNRSFRSFSQNLSEYFRQIDFIRDSH